MPEKPARPARRKREAPAPAAIDTTRAANRLRAAEWALTEGSRRIDVDVEIAELRAEIGCLHAELATKEKLLALKYMERTAIEKAETAKAEAFGPMASPTLTLQQATGLLGCGEATAKKLAERHGFGWYRDGRWRFSRLELVHYVSGLPTERADF